MAKAKKVNPLAAAVPAKTFRGDIVAAANDDQVAPEQDKAAGFKGVMYRMAPYQVTALRAEAFKRAEKAGSGRPDASEVVREIVDGWIKRGRR